MVLATEERVELLVTLEAVVNIFVLHPFILTAERRAEDLANLLVHKSNLNIVRIVMRVGDQTHREKSNVFGGKGRPVG